MASSDLASAHGSNGYDALLRIWLNVMAPAGITPEGLERTRAAYAKDVAILPPSGIADIIASAGFEPPVQFFQAGLMHAWFARRASSTADSGAWLPTRTAGSPADDAASVGRRVTSKAPSAGRMT